MRNIAIIVLSALLATAIILGSILYREYIDTKDTLLISKKNLSDLNEKLTQLNQETSALQDQVRKNAEALKELESAKELISELENAITIKDQITSELKKMTRILQKSLEQEKKAKEALFTELASRDALITELQERVQGFQSNILYLEEQIAKEHSEIQRLHRALSDLEGQKVILQTKIGQLKSNYEALISKRLKELESAQVRICELENAINVRDQRLSEFGETLRTVQEDLEEERKAKEALETELTSKETMVTELQERLQGAQSYVLSLENEIAKDQNEIKGLAGKLLALKGKKATAETKIGQLKSTYEALVSDLKEQIDKQEVTIKRFEEKISVSFIDRILFAFGRATISPQGEEILQKVGETLEAVKGKKIRVVGHTDDRPIHPEYYYKFPSNWELSAARASAVVRHFQDEIGLDPGSLEAVGRSSYDPIAGNETPEGRAQNRRVEIIIAPQLD